MRFGIPTSGLGTQLSREAICHNQTWILTPSHWDQQQVIFLAINLCIVSQKEIHVDQTAEKLSDFFFSFPPCFCSGGTILYFACFSYPYNFMMHALCSNGVLLH